MVDVFTGGAGRGFRQAENVQLERERREARDAILGDQGQQEIDRRAARDAVIGSQRQQELDRLSNRQQMSQQGDLLTESTRNAESLIRSMVDLRRASPDPSQITNTLETTRRTVNELADGIAAQPNGAAIAQRLRQQADIAATAPMTPATGQQTGVTGGVAPQGGTNLTRGAQTRLQNQVVNEVGFLDGLRRTQDLFQREFQTTPARLRDFFSGTAERLGFEVDPTERQFLERYQAFRREAFNTLSERLNALSGAAITEQEAQRLLRTIPNPGTGLFDGDSPSQFVGKMNQAIKASQLIIARRTFMLRNGIDFDFSSGDPAPVSLAQTEALMERRGQELKQQFMDEGLSEDAARVRAAEQTAREFGL